MYGSLSQSFIKCCLFLHDKQCCLPFIFLKVLLLSVPSAFRRGQICSSQEICNTISTPRAQQLHGPPIRSEFLKWSRFQHQALMVPEPRFVLTKCRLEDQHWGEPTGKISCQGHEGCCVVWVWILSGFGIRPSQLE